MDEEERRYARRNPHSRSAPGSLIETYIEKPPDWGSRISKLIERADDAAIRATQANARGDADKELSAAREALAQSSRKLSGMLRLWRNFGSRYAGDISPTMQDAHDEALGAASMWDNATGRVPNSTAGD